MSRRKRDTLLAQITIPSCLSNGVLIPTADPAFMAYCEVDFKHFLEQYTEEKNLSRLVGSFWGDFRRRAKSATSDLPVKSKEQRRIARAELSAKRLAALTAQLNPSNDAGSEAEASGAPPESPAEQGSEDRAKVAAGDSGTLRNSGALPPDPAPRKSAHDTQSKPCAVDAPANHAPLDSAQTAAAEISEGGDADPKIGVLSRP